jgi:plasmid stabilization system protein ParE
MTRIRLRKGAVADLRAIAAYYGESASASLANIMLDIHRSLDLLLDFPLVGMKVPNRHFRRIVTVRYRFKIIYEVDGDHILVLGIFRYQNREG